MKSVAKFFLNFSTQRKEDAMRSAEYWVEKLDLKSHPEGGYFRETYRCAEEIRSDHLPERYGGARAYSTAIYYLLKGDQFSAFHRLKSEEMWHFYAGTTLTISSIDEVGALRMSKLGSNPDAGESFQIMIPAGWWLGARCDNPEGYALVGTTMAPGFDFADFEIAKREDLLQKYPEHQRVVESLTKQ